MDPVPPSTRSSGQIRVFGLGWGGLAGSQEADLLELEVQQGELAGSEPAPTEEAAPATPGAPAVTTIMISNIPMAVAQSGLLGLINRTGFASRHDYACMPIAFEAGTTQGIAFVNLATPRGRLRVLEAVDSGTERG
ncbi:unnamed protein product [Prorocentrum cordatum]|uniref:Mei2-like C-terminal RNA recognition motif domain-containing protein n=1 Tax=Prorocentrum cordatum TaxID=2364126 RepID=A0ABN9T811_9DINO|nr:unnamed protein product [Polarella glacialis]